MTVIGKSICGSLTGGVMVGRGALLFDGDDDPTPMLCLHRITLRTLPISSLHSSSTANVLDKAAWLFIVSWKY